MFYIGTSGYMYQHWNNGVFYPRGVKDRLAFYLERFNTLEINSSFYSIPKPETVANWNDKLPKHFQLVLKAPRSVTHTRMLTLRNLQRPDMKQGVDLYDYFLNSYLRVSERKRGPVLVQIPEKLVFHEDRLRKILRMSAAYDFKVALEVRHQSWINDKTFELLHEYGGSLVISDWPSVQTPIEETGDFFYLRRHGLNGSYAGEYKDKQLLKDVQTYYGEHHRGRDIYVYFNNDIGGAAPRNALRMKELLKKYDSDFWLLADEE